MPFAGAAADLGGVLGLFWCLIPADVEKGIRRALEARQHASGPGESVQRIKAEALG